MRTRLIVALLAAPAAAQVPFQLTRHTPQMVFTSWYDSAAGDVDGDGDIDLVVANDHAPNQLFLNNGNGVFVDATTGRLTTPTTPPPGNFFSNATYAVDLADIDGDGDLDLLLVNDHDLPDRVHVNNGAGVFTDVSATALPPNANWSTDQAVGDFDGDGDVDWFVGAYPPKLYLNNGVGVFVDVTATHLPAALGWSGQQNRLQAVDLDQDNDLDLLMPGSNAPAILLNQGNGTFLIAAPVAPLHFGFAYAADLDNDGREDLLVGSGRYWMRGLGGFAFGPAQDLGTPTYRAVDVDLDGDLDLITSQSFVLNQGAGVFALQVAGHPGAPTSLAVDVDGDRDQDLVTHSGRVYVNMLRQVKAPSAPVRGQTWTLESTALFTTQPVTFLPMLSAAPAAVSLPPFGTLRIDPGLGVLLPPQNPFNSTTSLGIVVPNIPAAAGFAVYCQALILEPAGPRLSNAFRDVIP